MKPIVSACIATLLLCPLAQAQSNMSVSSGVTTTPMLELFTSQGCSSCPPAERWMSELKDHPALWTGLIPLAFHVDYWDSLGWPDPFANPGFSARQRAYNRIGASRAVYTPGFMLAGREWRGWFQRQPLKLTNAAAVGKLTLDLDGDRVRLTFVANQPLPEGMTAHVARLGFGLRSKVTRGENAGQTLEHDFVVLSLQQIGANSANQWQTQLQADSRGERQALVAWLSSPGQPQPYQAVAGWLPGSAGD
ncbi:hypothetical protein TMS3_0113560 [Pseudomonas taeanensis MS-3]|uniref:DUF1223 domain-containing protein n=1 Tax=Pseudomonas taeanensis MS-3 TaxID=1395571 RepID=A0A0A1YKI1_9PSED|nr:DUF1223 domain-containing protein [Pseudomonas taeanensis]KFX69448.1 hypothetical protein TMS3_0113560 [Pseudomonas taeanensis MS-3]